MKPELKRPPGHLRTTGLRGPDRIGRRERNKLEKLARIKKAARDLFSRQGVEATTIREIAAAADIGLGTMFLYAASKEDLLVMIFREEIGYAIGRAFATVPSGALRDQVEHVFAAIITHHRRNPNLGNVFAKEMPFIAGSRHAIGEFMADLYARLAVLIDEAKARGELRRDIPPTTLARNLFAIFFQHLQFWLAHRTSSPEFDRIQLTASLELQLMGLREANPPFNSGARINRSGDAPRTRSTKKS